MILRIITTMLPRDTSSDVQRLMDEHYRRMTPAEKLAAVDDAWQTARTLALAGLRLDFPQETEEQLDLRWAERRLGKPLFERAMAQRQSSSV